MFAIEIDFHDGISPPETILVRRSNAIVGTSDQAHVVVEGAATSACELRLLRGLGREFSCLPIHKRESTSSPTFIEGTYSGGANLRLGSLGLFVTPLDVDLNLLANEFPDRAAVRIVRSALTRPSPVFPAVVVNGARPMYVSFFDDLTLVIGRSRNCGLRLDASDVSGEHARVGVEGGSCWVEDLGSTNGTFVGEVRISGRHYLGPGERISVGSEFSLAIVLSEEDLGRLGADSSNEAESSNSGYPCLLSNSPLVKPQSLSLKPNVKVTVGRDPANHIWVNAPHISRSHLELIWNGEGLIQVMDTSSNGTFYAGDRLVNGKATNIETKGAVFDLCSDIELALCLSADDQRTFRGDLSSSDKSLSRDQGSGEESFLDLGSAAQLLEGDNSSAAFSARMEAYGSISEKEAREILEKAAGLASEEEPPEGEISSNIASGRFSGSGVFTRLAKEREKEGHKFGRKSSLLASKELGTQDGGLTDFGEYQESRRRDGSVMDEFDPDFSLLSEAEFDEDLLESGSFGGLGRLAIMALVIMLVLVILVLFINIFTGRVF